MREITERRTCDRCKTTLYRDAGEWMGGQMNVNERRADRAMVVRSQEEYDLCQHCVVELKTWMQSAT